MPVYRLLENKTVERNRSRRRAGNKTGSEGLPVERSSSREQDREINGLIDALGTRQAVKRCPSNDRLLENKTERQTVSSTRWEQEPGALPVKRSEALPDQRSVPDHVKFYKRALLEAGRTSATVARRLSVLRGTYHQLAAKGLVSWETLTGLTRSAGSRSDRSTASADRGTRAESSTSATHGFPRQCPRSTWGPTARGCSHDSHPVGQRAVR